MGDIVHLVSFSSGRPGLRSATTAQYVNPKLITVFGERAFSFAGPIRHGMIYLVTFTLAVTSTD